MLVITGGVYMLLGRLSCLRWMRRHHHAGHQVAVDHLAQTAEMDKRIQAAILAQVPEVKGVVARAGSDELGMDPMGFNETDTFLVLAPVNEWRSKDKTAIMDTSAP